MIRGRMSGSSIGLALLVITFVAGALAGAAVNRVLEARPASTAAAPAQRGSCEEREQDVFERLDLSPQQRERVDEILTRRREQADIFWQESGPRLRVLMDSTRAEIRNVLTPEQRAEYDRHRQERKERRDREEQERRERRSGGAK
jgi:Spy/CpxP family protein refolding chaperone